MNNNENNEELECSTIIMKDEETGEDIELIIIDYVEFNNQNYFLVTEAESFDSDDDFEALILKESQESGEDSIYSIVEDDNELKQIIKLFEESTDEYDIEI